MSKYVGTFEEDLINRMKRDESLMSDSIMDIFDSLNGKNTYHAGEKSSNKLKYEIETIYQHYKLPVPQNIPNASNSAEVLNYYSRASGMMHRSIVLNGKWWENGECALLTTKKSDNEAIALLPGKISGYYYIDYESGRKVKVNRRNKNYFEENAVCFYRPLPRKKMSPEDFLKFLIDSISAYDYILVFLVTALATLLGMITPLATKIIFENIIPTGKGLLVITITGVLVAAAVAGYFISVVKLGLLERIKGRIDIVMNNSVMSRVMNLPVRFFSDKNTGGLADSIISLGCIPDIIANVFCGSALTAAFSLAYIFEIAVIAPELAWQVFITVGVQLAIILISIKQKMKIIQKELAASMDTLSMSYSIITGIQRIRLSGSEKRILSRWLNVYKNKANPAYHFTFPSWVQNDLVILAGLLGTLWVYFSGFNSGIEISKFAAFISAFALSTAGFTALSQSGEAIAYIRPIMEMIQPVLREVPENSDEKSNTLKLNGDIEMNHVSFKYTEDGPNIIDDISLKIRPGEYLGIVGTSGCGKSTLMHLLLGFISPDKGIIAYNGKNVEEINYTSLRRNIGTVLQDGKLFSGDIFSNITISAPWLTLSDAWEAAEIAGIADSIRDMPMGMNTVISEGGGGVSGGQKQRLMIARAIVNRPKILMFDEATSALDNITQKNISDALEKMECTRLVIAHRLSTIKNCDRIIVMDKGRIIEEGTYESLSAENGVFAELVSRQQM